MARNDSEPFIVYTIHYDHPENPNKFSVLMSETRKGVIVAYEECIKVADTLEQARTAIPPGYHPFGPAANDDQTIVESWI